MEIARGVRQLLVHHSGIVTRDFIATYPQFPAAVDTRVRLPSEFTLDLASSVGSLVSAADHAIAHRIARAGGNGCPLRDP